MSKSKSIHSPTDLSHYHTDYLWNCPARGKAIRLQHPEFYEDIADGVARAVMDMLFFGDSGGTRRTTAAIITLRSLRHQMAAQRHDADDSLHVARGAGVRLRDHHVDTYHHPFPSRASLTTRPRYQGPHAWNAVTSRSKNEAANYGYKKMIEHDER